MDLGAQMEELPLKDHTGMDPNDARTIQTKETSTMRETNDLVIDFGY